MKSGNPLGATPIKSKIYLVQATSAPQFELTYRNNMMIHASFCRLPGSSREAGLLIWQHTSRMSFFGHYK